MRWYSWPILLFGAAITIFLGAPQGISKLPNMLTFFLWFALPAWVLSVPREAFNSAFSKLFHACLAWAVVFVFTIAVFHEPGDASEDGPPPPSAVYADPTGVPDPADER